jgi:hypothetical protein
MTAIDSSDTRRSRTPVRWTIQAADRPRREDNDSEVSMRGGRWSAVRAMENLTRMGSSSIVPFFP